MDGAVKRRLDHASFQESNLMEKLFELLAPGFLPRASDLDRRLGGFSEHRGPSSCTELTHFD